MIKDGYLKTAHDVLRRVQVLADPAASLCDITQFGEAVGILSAPTRSFLIAGVADDQLSDALCDPSTVITSMNWVFPCSCDGAYFLAVTVIPESYAIHVSGYGPDGQISETFGIAGVTLDQPGWALHNDVESASDYILDLLREIQAAKPGGNPSVAHIPGQLTASPYDSLVHPYV